MRDEHPQPVEDYTNAFLAMAWWILFMFFFTLAAIAGFLWVAVVATGLSRLITFFGRRVAR